MRRRHILAIACLGFGLSIGACTNPEPPTPTPEQQDGDGDADDQTADTDQETSTGPSADTDQETSAGGTGPLPDGSASSCAEQYAPAAVGNRAFAFDGEVVEIGPSVSNLGDGSDLDDAGVTLEVHEWFTGGDADTVTVDLQEPDSANQGGTDDGPAYEVGTRLLISGEPRWGGERLDAPIAWGCGFSRYHDGQTADAWREAIHS